MRHKTKSDDRYLRHKERNLVLELGKDVSIGMFVYSCLLPKSPLFIVRYMLLFEDALARST